MRKKLFVVCLIAFCCALISCANNDENIYIDKNIDSIATYLGYTEGKVIINPGDFVPGAIAGKEYNEGRIVIYQFDPDSFEYEDLQNQMAICNGGFVLMFKDDADTSMSGAELEDFYQRFLDIEFE